MGHAASSSRSGVLPWRWDGVVKVVRAGLGISAFGVNVLDIGANYTTGDHTENESGQEELYLVLHSSATLLVGLPGEEGRRTERARGAHGTSDGGEVGTVFCRRESDLERER